MGCVSKLVVTLQWQPYLTARRLTRLASSVLGQPYVADAIEHVRRQRVVTMSVDNGYVERSP